MRDAATSARKDDIAELRAALAANREAIPDSQAFYRTDTAFHAVLYRIPRNPIFPAIHLGYTAWLAPQWDKMERSRARNEISYHGHQAILDGILSRDPAAAEEALVSHLDAAWRHVEATFEFDAPMSASFDHIVVGGGSSGCVVAARLASEGKARVLLLEAGHSNRHPLLDMPPGIFKMINGSKFMRYHHTTPQAHLDGRVHDIPQGHVLGGGSSVNAQVYMRGRPADYDEWDEILRGNNDGVGWGWDDVLPHFRGMEGNNRLHNERHGTDGPMLVSDPGHINEVSRWFVQAVQAPGRTLQPRLQRRHQRGVGFYQFMNRHGQTLLGGLRLHRAARKTIRT